MAEDKRTQKSSVSPSTETKNKRTTTANKNKSVRTTANQAESNNRVKRTIKTTSIKNSKVKNVAEGNSQQSGSKQFRTKNSQIPDDTISRQGKVSQAFGVQPKSKKVPHSKADAFDSLIQQLIYENRRNRNWGVFFKLATLVFLFSFLYLLFSVFDTSDSIKVTKLVDTEEEFTAVIEVAGIIAPGESASADSIISKLNSAFEDKNTRGIILDINSPGGSPVQSGQVFDEIRRLRELYKEIPVYAVISDLGASGAYYIAAAADAIYADKSSLVGSIGVISSSFGFTQSMEKLGIDRRLIVAGENKAFLDPFSPQNDKMTAFWQRVLDKTHQQFIDSVRIGRGNKIREEEGVYSGLIYNGEQALDLGLIDGLGDTRYVAREIIGYEKMNYLTDDQQDWLELARRFGTTLGTSFSRAFLTSQSQPSLQL